MIRAIRDVVVSFIIGAYLGFGITAGIVSLFDIKKLKEEVTILQYKAGMASASNYSK